MFLNCVECRARMPVQTIDLLQQTHLNCPACGARNRYMPPKGPDLPSDLKLREADGAGDGAGG